MFWIYLSNAYRSTDENVYTLILWMVSEFRMEYGIDSVNLFRHFTLKNNIIKNNIQKPRFNWISDRFT